MGTLLEKFTSQSTNLKSQMGSKHSNLKNEDIEAFSKSSGMSPEEVKAEYTGFLEKFPDGSIDKKEFKDVVKLLLPSEDAEKQEGYMFRIFDASNDGKIDFIEFMTYYNIMTGGTTEEKLKSIFRVYDINSDGNITKRELKKLLKDLSKMGNPDIGKATNAFSTLWMRMRTGRLIWTNSSSSAR